MITVSFKYTCSECGLVTESPEISIALDAEMVRPCLPMGWGQVFSREFCYRHEVTITPASVSKNPDNQGAMIE